MWEPKRSPERFPGFWLGQLDAGDAALTEEAGAALRWLGRMETVVPKSMLCPLSSPLGD